MKYYFNNESEMQNFIYKNKERKKKQDNFTNTEAVIAGKRHL